MADDEGRDEKTEDLFEDLDKFFAPIQGMDWPEPEEGEEPATPPAAPGEPHVTALGEPEPEPEPPEVPEIPEAPSLPSKPEEVVEVVETVEAAAVETPEGIVEAVEVVEAVEPAGTAGTAGTTTEVTEAGVAEAEVEEPPSEVLIDEEAGELGDMVGGRPAAAVAPAEGEEPEIAVIAAEETPAEDVDAAAEHFAASVRDEPAGDTQDDILAELDAEPEPKAVKVDTEEGLRGVSWQEPTAEEVGADTGRTPGGRDVPAAFLTGIGLAAVALVTLYLGAPWFALAAGLLVLAGQGEFYYALQRKGHQPATFLGLVFGALTLVGAYFHGVAAMVAMLALCVIFSFVWEMATPVRHRVNVLVNVSITLLGVVYIPFLAGTALVILRFPSGPTLVLAVLGLTFVYDTAAFLVGSLWGNRPLAPSISPRKSLEGAAAATLVVLLLGLGALPQIKLVGDTGIDIVAAAVLALTVAIFAPLGDLAESLLKRDLGIKDMGRVLPGHGGIIDRIDSVLFVAPVALMVLFAILSGQIG